LVEVEKWDGNPEHISEVFAAMETGKSAPRPAESPVPAE
jgi:hypothetical protein